MMPNYQAFTLQANGGLLNALITSCGVSFPFIPQGGSSQPEIITYKGLWDTGATGSVISNNVVQKLNLQPISKCKSFNANGECIVNVYLVNLYLPNGVAFTGVQVSEGILNGFDILIGMNIITRGDFSLTNHNGITCFSFRLPSIKKVDFVEESRHIPIVAPKKIERNDPCPCGSGRKYKNCCGK